MIIPCQRQMYQSNCFWTTTLLSTTHFSYILVLFNNYSKISWVSVSSANILSHKLIQRMHHFPFAYRPRLTSIMPWQSMFWVGNGANRTKLQGIPSCWEHSWVQGLIVSSSIHINKRCCPYRHTYAISRLCPPVPGLVCNVLMQQRTKHTYSRVRVQRSV